MLACTGVVKRFGGFIAVKSVSLAVEDRQILGIAGPNGAGKTTLFDVLSGHIRPEAGRVELQGRDVTRLPAERRARLGLARTFQSPLVPTQLTVGEVLDAARRAWLPSLSHEAVPQMRDFVGFAASNETVSGQLDTLNRRKLLLACLLMRRPKVLLLDEPCSGLLNDEINEMDRVIRRIAHETGAAIAVVEHRLELLFAVAERVVVMDEGKIIADGAPQDVFAEPVVRRAYFEAPQAA